MASSRSLRKTLNVGVRFDPGITIKDVVKVGILLGLIVILMFAIGFLIVALP